jgi:predicted alpha/beta hydrolase
MHNTRPHTITTSDGTPLAGTLFGDSSAKPVLIASALGVPQTYYAAFAQWLGARGHLVMTFDLRGMGASRPRSTSLRHMQGDMLTWAQQDFASAVETLCALSGQPQITVIGHSLGTHHAAMSTAAAQSRIARLLAVASGSGYWRDWAPRTRNLAPLMLHLASPVLTPLFGYFPGKRLGMVGDLPPGVIRQWTRWCRHPGFAWGSEPHKLLPVLATARYPIHALAFSDDEMMSLRGVHKLLQATPNAPSTVETITPQSVGARHIGHLGAFRVQHQDKLWPHIARCLD